MIEKSSERMEGGIKVDLRDVSSSCRLGKVLLTLTVQKVKMTGHVKTSLLLNTK